MGRIAVALLLVPTLGAQAPAGLLIRGGRLVDGTGARARTADVRSAGDAIVEIGPALTPRGERIIDAAGRIVAPGFIDPHSHADRGIEEMPGANSQIQQGITTALVGQDGGSALPVAEFIDTITEARPAINFGTSIGHGTVRRAVMGADFARPATDHERETMGALVRRGMRDGAFGLSSGLEYDPGFYATGDEVADLARVIVPFDGLYSTHVRDEENEVVAAWREAIEVGRRTGVRVHLSHMKLASKPVWGRAADALALLDAAQREGIRVTGDWYPYAYWQSALYVLIPDRDFDNVEKWRVGLDEIGGAANVRITDYRPDPSWNGKTLDILATEAGLDPPALIVRMVSEAGPEIGIIGTAMNESDMEAILRHPQVVVCSDGALEGRHPRGYGAFPRVLAEFVRDRGVIGLEEAVARMTGRTAGILGLTDRGTIETGNKADLVIFDASAVRDRGTPETPALPPAGIETVIVNGEVVLDGGTPTGARPGRALRPARRE